jgi:hypothetical protein
MPLPNLQVNRSNPLATIRKHDICMTATKFQSLSIRYIKLAQKTTRANISFIGI